MPAKKPFQKSKQLQALEHSLELEKDVITGLLNSKKTDLKANFGEGVEQPNILPQLIAIYKAALKIEEENFAAGKKDNTHLAFVVKTTKLVQRANESNQGSGKKFSEKEVEKIARSFENEFHVNKKLRIAGAVLLGLLVVAAIAAIAFATFGLATTIPLAGVTGLAAFKAFMVAAAAKMAATAVGITGSTAGIAALAGTGATLGFTATIAGLGARIAGSKKQERLDALLFEKKAPDGEVINSGKLGTSIHGLFTTFKPGAGVAMPTHRAADAEAMRRVPSVGSIGS